MDSINDAGQEGTDRVDDPSPEYAIVEIFGHRRFAGEVCEVERFGAKMLRIDVPTDGDFGNGVTTQFYAGGAIFSITPTDLTTVRKMNEPYRRPGTYSLPAPADEDDQDDTRF